MPVEPGSHRRSVDVATPDRAQPRTPSKPPTPGCTSSGSHGSATTPTCSAPYPPADAATLIEPHSTPGSACISPVFGSDKRVIMTHSQTLHALKVPGPFDLGQDHPGPGRAGAPSHRPAARSRCGPAPSKPTSTPSPATGPGTDHRTTGTTRHDAADCGASTPPPTGSWKPRSSANASWSPTTTSWTSRPVVAALPLSKSNDVESGFRQPKEPTRRPGSPPHVPLDRLPPPVHVFYSRLAPAVCHLMRRQAHPGGRTSSVHELPDHTGHPRKPFSIPLVPLRTWAACILSHQCDHPGLSSFQASSGPPLQ